MHAAAGICGSAGEEDDPGSRLLPPAARRTEAVRRRRNPAARRRVRADPRPYAGHAGYLFSSAEQQLLVWGDLVHSHAVQFARPEVTIEFDIDNKRAIASRKRVFADVARKKLWVAGAHLPFPGIGHVRAERKGYAWVPVEYAPLRAKQ